ncbi:MAG: hypothetical protein ACE5K2_07260 [Candidatus Zixiibacteriota bacterium]
MVKRASCFFVIIVAVISWMADSHAFSRVIREDGKAYIVDATGERWDVTQAESIGFKPEGFQFGLGRDAFTPLDDTFLSDDIGHVPENLRVLGVVKNSRAHAYSIPRLLGHETANSTIGSKPIVVGF